MPSEQLTFRRRDLKAAIQAAKDAGLSIARIEVCKDGVAIIPGEPTSKPADLDIEEPVNPFDEATRNAKT